jgi:hypothetical protein
LLNFQSAQTPELRLLDRGQTLLELELGKQQLLPLESQMEAAQLAREVSEKYNINLPVLIAL